MSWPTAILFGVLAVSAGVYVLFMYLRREVGVAGRSILAALRIGAVVVVLLLLLDPTLPAAAPGLGGGGSWTLVDGSRSMAASPESPWPGVLRDAAARPGDGVLVFGGADPLAPAAVDTADLPPFSTSRLLPAVERAAESGARSVRVVSDLRLEDAARVRDAAERLGVELLVAEVSPAGLRSAGVASVEFVEPPEAGEPVPAEAAVFAVGTAPGDSVRLEVREEGRLMESRSLAAPEEGRLARVTLELPPPESEGEVRYTARAVLDGDAYPDDDERVAWADVNPDEGNLVLVSLDPDWELRFLVPVLGRVTGLPARAFMALGADRFLDVEPEGAGGTVDQAAVEGLAAGAELLVVQASSAPPPWLEEALGTVPRALVLARGPGAAGALGVRVGPPRPGEWYVSPELPPSALAGELAGVEVVGLPPLVGVLPLMADDPPGPVPLDVELGGGTASERAMVLIPGAEGGRRVLALASGFWRWGFRDGDARDAYERLWSGIGGWLLADEPLAGGLGVRPEERSIPWRESGVWNAVGLAGAEVAVRLSRSDTVVLDTVVRVPETGRFRLPPLEAGTYDWSANVVPQGDAEGWDGRLDVELWTPDLRHPRDTLLEQAGEGMGAAAFRAPGRPLRTHPAPYLLILALLCLEWIGRRRKGLR